MPLYTPARAARRLPLLSANPLRTISQFPKKRPTTLPLVVRRLYSGQQQQQRQSFFNKLSEALKNTKIEWYAIPVGVGAGVIGFTQLRKNYSHHEEGRSTAIGGGEPPEPENKKQVRPMGSWQVHILSAIPFKLLSYYWGRFNEISLPRFLRVPGFKLYSLIFGVNLDEVAEPLDSYRNLGEFFYRQLKPGSRPVDPRPNSVASPADGRVLQFGEVRAGGEVEQVKGMTYSLDALLGEHDGPAHSEGSSPNTAALVKKKLESKSVDIGGQTAARYGKGGDSDPDAAVVMTDEEFANLNGISYTVPSLLSGSGVAVDRHDASLPASSSDALKVGTEVARKSTWVHAPQKRLFFCVIYLAPGDYHRFHSPVSWVVERRRHFAGELYSVSPWIQSRLKNLFVLNERVVLLGRWRHGMFSMTPVGATNVGSIKIHFDSELRTNSLMHHATGATTKGGFAEATYKGASALLGGHPVPKGSEIGGFNLGSTVVLVFEAPATNPDGPPGEGGFRFCVERGQTVKMGQALGVIEA